MDSASSPFPLEVILSLLAMVPLFFVFLVVYMIKRSKFDESPSSGGGSIMSRPIRDLNAIMKWNEEQKD